MKLFLRPEKTLQTRQTSTCDGCAVQNTIHCHFTAKELLHFLLICLPPFFLGGVPHSIGDWLWS